MWTLKDWRRRRILRRIHFPESLWRRVVADLPILERLDDTDLVRLRDLMILFLHEKSLETVGDWRLDDDSRLRIAAYACLPILNLGLDYYGDWVSVVIYPSGFRVRHEYLDNAGVMHYLDEVLAGESWQRGPLILSLQDVNDAGDLDGFNVVIHECVHKLDMLTGEANGFPPLHRGMRIEAWSRAFTAAYKDLCRRANAGLETALDPYAAESPAEFFAITSEAFFEIPGKLRAIYPEVYRQLAAFYRQDPERSAM